MKAGELNRRITLYKPTAADDPLFGPQPGPDAVFAERIPAKKMDDRPSNTEGIVGGLQMSEHSARITIRYMRGVTSDMRVVLHDDVDRVYAMTSSPAEIGNKEWLEFSVKAFSS